MLRFEKLWSLISLGFLALGSHGCEGGGGIDLQQPCGAGVQAFGLPAGLPAGPICASDVCTDGIQCAETIEVSGESDLASAAGAAGAGTCLALLPGSYGPVTLPAGVHLLGKGAAFVTVESVTVSGANSVVRGIRVENGVMIADGAQDARIDSTCVTGSETNGIAVSPGASATVVASEIYGAKTHGILALDPASLTIETTVVGEMPGRGIWVQCGADGCDCPAPPPVTLQQTVVHDTAGLGVSFRGVQATVKWVEVHDIAGEGFTPGVGLVMASCTDLSASLVRVYDEDTFEKQYGILVQESKGSLGTFSAENNLFGMWLTDIGGDGASFEATGGTLEGNFGLNLGLGGETKGIIVNWLSAVGAIQENVAVEGGSSADVGDGVYWAEGVQATLSNITLGDSEREAILIDGEVGANSSLSDVTFEGGDQGKSILLQDLPSGALEPVTSNVPPLNKMTTKLRDVAVPPSVPSSM